MKRTIAIGMRAVVQNCTLKQRRWMQKRLIYRFNLYHVAVFRNSRRIRKLVNQEVSPIHNFIERTK